MWELLFLCPFDIILATLIMIIMMSLWSVLKLLLEVDLLSLREPFSCGFTPSVIELKEHVV